LVDKDFSGVISREELRALIENALYIVTSDAAFDIIFNTIDADASGFSLSLALSLSLSFFLFLQPDPRAISLCVPHQLEICTLTKPLYPN
jgi:hypothetical protein